MEYPKWSEIAPLLRRLRKRKHADCIAAAMYIEDLRGRLHNSTGELDEAKRRLTTFGVLLERAATQAREEIDGARKIVDVSLPSPTWFQLLSNYRTKSEGEAIFRELQLHREIAGITMETIRAVDAWLGHAGTREAAMESLWRLTRILEKAGFEAPHDHLAWRGQIIRALEEAGLGIGEDGSVRVRDPADKYWQPASGPLISELLAQLPTSVTHPQQL